VDLGLPESELLDFVNTTTAETLTGDVGLSDADAALVTNYVATVGAFTSKAQVLTVVNVCTVAIIETYLIKLKDPGTPPDPPDPPDPPSDQTKLLTMLNHESTDLEVLDIDAGLNKKAAQGLISYRDGPDGTYGTADDNFFDSEAEVDAVSYVGPAAMAQLKAFAETWEPKDSGGPKPEQKLLDFLNHPTITFVVLDEDVGLNKNAALNLIAHRNGPDGSFGTADDNLFDDLDEVDDVIYVGPTALAVLLAYTENWQKPDENAELLSFVNDPQATLTVFDDDVALNSLAAKKIIAHRDGPDGESGTGDDNLFDTVEELDAVPYVGTSALNKLFEFAPFWAAMPKGPPKAAQFLNHESVTMEFLKSQLGIKTPAATGLIAHRNGPDGELGTADDDPYDSLSEIDDIKYVGSVTLQALVDFAEQWVAP
jgi:DNA uptake protein ComE-like DNA-binding protein